MPYTGVNDSGLPNQVQRLPKHLREIWVAVFNDNFDPEDEGKAFRIAWGAVRAADKEKQKMAWDWRRTLQHAAERMGLEPPPLSEGDAEVLDAATKGDEPANLDAGGIPALAAEKKYNEDQPRAPKGDPEGGQWVSQGGKPASQMSATEKLTVMAGIKAEVEAALKKQYDGKPMMVKPSRNDFDAMVNRQTERVFEQRYGDDAVQWISEPIKTKPIVIRKEPHPLSSGKFIYRAYEEDGTPLYLGSEDKDELEDKLKDRASKFIYKSTAEKAAPWRTALKIQADREQPGRVRWTAISSGGFEDRDREVVSTAFLQSCVQTADKMGHRGPVDLLHVDGFEVGACDYQAVVGGEPGLLLESGLFDDTEAGRRAAAFYSQNADDTGVSIKFHYVNRTPDGVYQPPGLIVKRSFMPRTWAAFPWSAITVKEIEAMAKSKLSAEKRAELERILGTDLVETILEQAEKDTDVLKSLGVRFKELAEEGAGETGSMGAEANVSTKKAKPAKEDEEPVEEEEAVVVEETEAEAPAAEEPAVDAATDEEDDEEEDEDKQKMKEITTSGAPLELLLSDEALAAVAEKAVAGIRAEIAPLAESLNTLQAAFRKIAADVEQIKRDEDERVAEKIRHLPRATVKAITTQPVERPSQRPVETESDSTGGSLHQKAMNTLYGK